MKQKTAIIAVIGMMLASCGPKQEHINVQDEFTPLEAGAVHLDGFLDDYIRHSITQWNKGVVPYASFVDFFRHGRPQFALGEMWGKAVRSGCMFYRYTQDPELKSILDSTIQDMLSAQRPDGSISCSEPEQQPDGPNGDLWERKYVMLGMEEYYEWVNPDPAVLESLAKQVDCILAQVGKAPKTEITDLGWSATNIGYEPCHIESGTLLEPFMRLYKWTGERRFLDFAAYIVESGGTKEYNLFEQAYNNVEPHLMSGHYPKAYEMMSLFEGLVEYYRATNDPRIRQAFFNLYHHIREKEITIIGNGGGDQPYHPRVMGEAWDHTAFEQTNPDITRMMETCVGVTWMKFCSQILRLTGDVSTVDEIEKYVYNGLIGAMKPTGDGFSYVNLLNGCKVNDHGWGWTFGDVHVTCCNLNGPMGLAYLPYVAVMNSASGPVVNLYNAGTAMASTARGEPVKLEMITDYPLSGHILVRVTTQKPETFSIRLRIPSWSKATGMQVNGEPVSVSPGTYATIERKWSSDDRIELELDMRCRIIDAPHGSNRAGDHFQALVRGPVVLARDEKIDEHYNDPVSLVSKDGFAEIIPEDPTIPGTKMQFRVPTADGFIRMVDYASVNNWDGSHICTWLPEVQ